MLMITAKINVFLAYLCVNRGGKRVDVHGRKYRDVCKRFGMKAMAEDLLNGNSWYVSKRIGLFNG